MNEGVEDVLKKHELLKFQNMELFKGEREPVAEKLSRNEMYLPSSSGLKEEEIRYICDEIKERGGWYEIYH